MFPLFSPPVILALPSPRGWTLDLEVLQTQGPLCPAPLAPLRGWVASAMSRMLGTRELGFTMTLPWWMVGDDGKWWLVMMAKRWFNGDWMMVGGGWWGQCTRLTWDLQAGWTCLMMAHSGELSQTVVVSGFKKVGFIGDFPARQLKLLEGIYKWAMVNAQPQNCFKQFLRVDSQGQLMVKHSECMVNSCFNHKNHI